MLSFKSWTLSLILLVSLFSILGKALLMKTLIERVGNSSLNADVLWFIYGIHGYRGQAAVRSYFRRFDHIKCQHTWFHIGCPSGILFNLTCRAKGHSLEINAIDTRSQCGFEFARCYFDSKRSFPLVDLCAQYKLSSTSFDYAK